ncbi:MAG: hypothetical protein MUF31_06770 [Akkermansiaceae bacterium]|jgi:hypothetical protein|nr:hypothetical protein [Akkermansiaceae bacterium]
MKRSIVCSLVVVAFAAIFPSACSKKEGTVGEEVKEGVNDALDRRPGEGVRDAVEDAGDAAEDIGESVEDAAEEVGDAVNDAVR